MIKYYYNNYNVYTFISLNKSPTIDATMKMSKPNTVYHATYKLGFYGSPDDVPIFFTIQEKFIVYTYNC